MQIDVLYCSKLGENGTGLGCWTEIPNIILEQGRVGTAPDKGVDPTKSDPLEDGDIVFWGILDGLDTHIEVSKVWIDDDASLTISSLLMRLLGSSICIVETTASSRITATRLNISPKTSTRGSSGMWRIS